MRKVLFRIVYTIVIAVAIGFFIQNSISDKIDKKFEDKIAAKVTQLRANGFNVTYKKHLSSTKIVASGQIEIIDYPKVLKYIVKSKVLEDNEAINSQKQFFEGIVFDYDLSFDLLSSKLDLNIYLSKLSDKMMEKTSSFIKDMIEAKAFHINIDENYNFTFDDLKFLDLEKDMTLTCTGISGKFGEDYNLKIQDITFGNLVADNSMIFEGINIYKDTFVLGRLQLDDRANGKILKLLGFKSILSKKIKDDLLYVSIKATFNSLSSVDTNISDYNFNLYKPSYIEYIVNKIPIVNYEELIYSIFKEDHIDKLAEFLEKVSKSGLELKTNIDLQGLDLPDKYFIEEIHMEQDIIFSEKLNMKFKFIDDIFQTLSIEIKIDSSSFYNSIAKSPDFNEEYSIFVDTEDKKYKILKMEANREGIFINGRFSPVSLSFQSFFPDMKVPQNEDGSYNENDKNE